MKLLVIPTVIILSFLNACSLIGPRETGAKTYYVLQTPDCPAGDKSTALPGAVLIADTLASRLINSQRILFSRDSLTRGLYQFAFWLESPAARFPSLLLAKLECSPVFETQTRNATLAKADYLLNTELLEFYHDVSSHPSFARVKLRAELLDLHSRTIRSSLNISRDIQLEHADAANAAIGFNQATAQILAEITSWLGNIAGQKP